MKYAQAGNDRDSPSIEFRILNYLKTMVTNMAEKV